jgi:hypothetical protein
VLEAGENIGADRGAIDAARINNRDPSLLIGYYEALGTLVNDRESMPVEWEFLRPR